MTDQQINSTIAESCGWKRQQGPKPWQPWIDPHGETRFAIPGYCTDLNAMAQAEEALDDHAHAQFREELCRVCSDSGGFNYRKIYSANARQRAEAFLRVKGLWRDEAPEFGCQNIVTKG